VSNTFSSALSNRSNSCAATPRAGSPATGGWRPTLVILGEGAIEAIVVRLVFHQQAAG
jgi:hypothetical protein